MLPAKERWTEDEALSRGWAKAGNPCRPAAAQRLQRRLHARHEGRFVERIAERPPVGALWLLEVDSRLCLELVVGLTA